MIKQIFTDHTGSYSSTGVGSGQIRVAPGKYDVTATRMAINHSVDTIARLWRARARAEMVEADPGAALQLNRVPVPVE